MIDHHKLASNKIRLSLNFENQRNILFCFTMYTKRKCSQLTESLVYLYFYLFIHLSIPSLFFLELSFNLFIYVSVLLSIYLYTMLVCMSVCLFVSNKRQNG